MSSSYAGPRSVDDLLGRDFTFWRNGSIGSLVTVVAFDGEKGWKLSSRLYGPAWLSPEMFKRLEEEGVLTPR